MSVQILHIDTSGPSAVVMLALGSEPISHKISDTERDHAGKINYLVAQTLEEAKCSLKDLAAIAVCNGPGSYTGLRIGLATAKGYCYALNKPLILHNRLRLMLRELELQLGDDSVNRLAILPARTGEYYISAKGEFNAAPQHIKLAELLEALSVAKCPFAIIGKKEEDLSLIQAIYNEPHYLLNMSCWAGATHEAFMKSEFTDIAYAAPEYIKSAFITASRTDR